MSATRSRARVSTAALLTSVLMLALGVALGLLVGRFGPATQGTGVADPEIAHMLAERVDALNAGDTSRLAALYSDDAVLEEWDRGPVPVVTSGAEEIASLLAQYQSGGFRVAAESVAIQQGTVAPYVAEALSWTGERGGIVVYRLDGKGRIDHQWVIGGETLTEGP